MDEIQHKNDVRNDDDVVAEENVPQEDEKDIR